MNLHHVNHLFDLLGLSDKLPMFLYEAKLSGRARKINTRDHRVRYVFKIGQPRIRCG